MLGVVGPEFVASGSHGLIHMRTPRSACSHARATGNNAIVFSECK
jgi:hypothetical protein